MLTKIKGIGATRARMKKKIRPITTNKKITFNPSLNNTKRTQQKLVQSQGLVEE